MFDRLQKTAYPAPTGTVRYFFDLVTSPKKIREIKLTDTGTNRNVFKDSYTLFAQGTDSRMVFGSFGP